MPISEYRGVSVKIKKPTNPAQNIGGQREVNAILQDLTHFLLRFA